MDATQAMELTQATQMIKFLEEERRKDKATIAMLQERMQNHELKLDQQTAQIHDVQTTLAGAQDLIKRAAEFEQTVASYKNELVFLLDKREETWKKERTEADRLRQLEIKGLADQLGEFDKDAQVLRRYDEDLKARQAEEKRLNDVLQNLTDQVADLSKRSDDRMQAVTYLEEQRRADNRRISELEQEMTERRQKAEAQAAKLLLLEETIQKQRARIEDALQELKNFEKTIEEMRVAEFRREQVAKKYADQGEQVRQEMEEWRTQTQRFTEQYQSNKRALENLEGFQARQEKRQNEVAEMQRLAEDRLKRQWEEWQAAMDKEAKSRQLAAEEQWRIQEQKNQEYNDWIQQLQDNASVRQAHIEALLEARSTDAQHAIKAGQDTIERVEELLAEGRAIKPRKRKK
jgi:chromosome segregation ATPase